LMFTYDSFKFFRVGAHRMTKNFGWALDKGIR
jgi:hypothetical protein